MSYKLSVFRFLILSVTILGGLHGIAITIPLFFREDSQGIVTYFLLTCMLAVYAYITVSALFFWRHTNQSRPLWWALVVQIPRISLQGVVYRLAVGLNGAVALVFSHTGDKYTTGYETKWSVGSSWEISVFRNAPVELGINIVALGLLLLLYQIDHLENKPGAK